MNFTFFIPVPKAKKSEMLTFYQSLGLTEPENAFQQHIKVDFIAGKGGGIYGKNMLVIDADDADDAPLFIRKVINKQGVELIRHPDSDAITARLEDPLGNLLLINLKHPPCLPEENILIVD